MKSRKHVELRLRRRTLRTLTPIELRPAAGGVTAMEDMPESWLSDCYTICLCPSWNLACG